MLQWGRALPTACCAQPGLEISTASSCTCGLEISAGCLMCCDSVGGDLSPCSVFSSSAHWWSSRRVQTEEGAALVWCESSWCSTSCAGRCPAAPSLPTDHREARAVTARALFCCHSLGQVCALSRPDLASVRAAVWLHPRIFPTPHGDRPVPLSGCLSPRVQLAPKWLQGRLSCYSHPF